MGPALSEREKSELSGLIHIGSYDVYVLHGLFKTATETTGWNTKSLLKGLFELFHNSRARRSDYLKITGFFFNNI